MTTPRIQQLLDDIHATRPELHALLQQLRQQVLALGEVQEEVKYGGILFAAAQPFCGLFCYRSHVALEFGDGARLADAFHVLEGNGKLRRHLKLRTPADIVDKHVAHYLQLALLAQQPCAVVTG